MVFIGAQTANADAVSHRDFNGPLSVDFEIRNGTGGDCTLIGDWDSKTKTCTLNTDIVASGNVAYNGITAIVYVNGNGIVIDGNGHSITGTFSDIEMGVYLQKTNNVTVKNLTVSGCAYGIFITNGTKRATVQQNTVADNMVGIDINTNSNQNTVINNTVLDSSFSGIYLGYYADSNTITENTVLGNTYGIMLYGTADRNIITNNVLDKEVYVGWECYDNIIEGNTY